MCASSAPMVDPGISFEGKLSCESSVKVFDTSSSPWRSTASPTMMSCSKDVGWSASESSAWPFVTVAPSVVYIKVGCSPSQVVEWVQVGRSRLARSPRGGLRKNLRSRVGTYVSTSADNRCTSLKFRTAHTRTLQKKSGRFELNARSLGVALASNTIATSNAANWETVGVCASSPCSPSGSSYGS
jgi:hypothetical protein